MKQRAPRRGGCAKIRTSVPDEHTYRCDIAIAVPRRSSLGIKRPSAPITCRWTAPGGTIKPEGRRPCACARWSDPTPRADCLRACTTGPPAGS